MSRETEAGESVLVTAAKKIGATAGKLAALVGVEAPARAAAPKAARFEKKGKARLPRRAKKALKQKSAAAPA